MYDNLHHMCAAAVATDSTADVATFPIGFKANVKYVYALVNGTSAHATAFVIKFDKVPLAGSATGRGDGDCGQVSKTASVNQQGKFLYDIPAAHVSVEPGDQIVAQVTTANGEACAVDVGVVLEYVPEVIGNVADMVEAGP